MQDETLVETGLGRLRGVRHQGVVQFRGVPYALPPLEDRRFRTPAPHPPWTGERDATRHGPISPQPPSRLRTVMGDPEPLPQGEDCLTLTISTPGSSGGLRPVVVWLHGGAYLTGAGSLAWYDGARLAHQGDLVVVGVNYRLGALGYLCRPGLGDGSQGVDDVLAALQWVHDNVAAFGGDPDRVTLMGQSAGGGMISYLLARRKAPGLFRRAILHSAHFGRPPFSRAQGEERTARLEQLLGLDPGDTDGYARLQEVPVAALLDATAALAREVARPGDTGPPLMPVLDGLSTEDSFVAGAAAGAAGIELLIGTTRDEMRAFLGGPAFAEDGPDLARATDAVFRAPTVRLAGTTPVAWVYRFDWSPPGSSIGACHCIDLPFVFGTHEAWSGAQMLAGSDPDEVAALTSRVQEAWIGFARTGDPSPTGAPWPAYRAGDGLTRCFGGGSELIRDVREGVPAGAGPRVTPRPRCDYSSTSLPTE